MPHENKKEVTKGTDSNPDPITGAPGAHPVGTGLGAAAGGAATGAAIGSIAGPLGTAAGVAIGAVVGGLMGKAAAEAIDPTVEDAYWRENYQREPYVSKGTKYDDYADAYRTGYEGYRTHGQSRSFEQVEPDLRKSYEQNRKSSLAWDKAREAARAAWERVGGSNLERLIGYSVIDQKGDALGTVENLWADHNGRPAYLGVSTERNSAKTFVVPARSAEVSHNSRRVRLPFLMEKLKGAPSYAADVSFSEAMEKEIGRYYGLTQRSFASAPSVTTETGERTVQLKEESLKVGKREVEAGGVRLRKIVRTEVVNQPVELRREELVIERVPGSGQKATNATFEGEEIYIPLVQEEVVVAKDTVVREEVRVGKKSTTEHQTVSETVRKEDLQVENQRTSGAWAQHDSYWRNSYAGSAEKGRSYEDYQGAYRTGFEGYSRYKGRRFEDVEADLRKDYERNRGASSLTWEKVKQAVRDAWHRVEHALPGDADKDGR